jgi:hypothetical protein
MKTIEVTLYKFDELTEKAKEKAIKNYFDINIDHEWWDSIYYDARNVNLKISEFDIYARSIKIDFIYSAEETANKILSEYGQICSTYKLAESFLHDLSKLDQDSNDYEDDLTYLEDDFLSDLGEEYLSFLNSDYDYLTSEQSIIETFEANDYHFNENGKISG